MAKPKFSFSIPVLIDAATRLHGALTDILYATAMAERLHKDTDTPTDSFTTRFSAQTTLVGGKGVEQSSTTGDIGQLTKEQADALKEVERLSSGARRSAKLAFPGDTTLLHSEFQVGKHGAASSDTLEDIQTRTNLVIAACKKYAVELKEKGFLPKDATSLETNLGILTGKDLEQGKTIDTRIGLTAEKVTQANALYEMTLTVQNAARLEYPSTQAGTETARARFLLEVYPPRNNSDPAGGTQPPPPPVS